jgi:hypothetical protein
MVCPESDLPYPKDVIRRALLTVAGEAQTSQQPADERRESISAALLELETFVPDADAAAVHAFQESLDNVKADQLTGPPHESIEARRERLLPVRQQLDEQRVRAEAVLDRIRKAQERVLAEFTNDETAAREVDLASNPVVVGSGKSALVEAVANARIRLAGAIYGIVFVGFFTAGINSGRAGANPGGFLLWLLVGLLGILGFFIIGIGGWTYPRLRGLTPDRGQRQFIDIAFVAGLVVVSSMLLVLAWLLLVV